MHTLHGVTLDLRYFPLVVETYPVETPDADAVEDFLETRLVRLKKANGRFAVVADARAMRRGPDALARARMGEYTERHRAFLSQSVVGYCLVSESAVIRSVLTALEWVRRSPYRAKTARSVEGGVAWAQERLVEEGIPQAEEQCERWRRAHAASHTS